jgi:UDP-N-acetylmuramate dehydrogenase
VHIKENQPLAPFTTFGIGGPARWFVEAASEQEIAEAADWVRGRGVPLFVLGGGSNLLVADKGFSGLVLHVGLKGIERDGDLFRVGAGEDWQHCVEQTLGVNCAGLECLAGIPGTVGGTPVQNVGAYGQEVSSVIERVRALDLEMRRFAEFQNAECGFAYRRSRFNSTDRGRFIVTRVDYRLTPGGAPTLRYTDVQRAMEASRSSGSEHRGGQCGEPGLKEVAEAVRQIRRSKGMLLVDGDPDCRSAGSFFKNPVVSEDLLQKIAARSASAPPRFPAGPGAENAGRVKIPAAWLIEQAGFAKGYTMGNAGISTRHTLALINRGGACAAEILALAEKIRAAVETQFGLRLEIEPERVGF